MKRRGFPLASSMVDWMVRRSVRKDFRGVYWAPPTLPVPKPCILIANHHGWHDGYVLYLAARKLDLPFVMWVAEYRAFPLFGAAGAMDFDPDRPEVRTATIRRTVRLLKKGKRSLILFPEGELHRPPELLPFQRSLGFLAKAVDVPIVPVAIRYESSMHERPECHLLFGDPVQRTEDVGTGAREALGRLLDECRERVGCRPQSFELLHPGTPDVNERWGHKRR